MNCNHYPNSLTRKCFNELEFRQAKPNQNKPLYSFYSRTENAIFGPSSTLKIQFESISPLNK